MSLHDQNNRDLCNCSFFKKWVWEPLVFASSEEATFSGMVDKSFKHRLFPLNVSPAKLRALPIRWYSVLAWWMRNNKWVVFFFVMWGLIILLVPTRGLRLAYAVTVGAYASRSWRKFAYAAYARVVLFRKRLRGYSPGGFFDLSHSSNVRKTKRHQTFWFTKRDR